MSKDTQQNAIRLVEAATEAMTDGMVERLSITGANALEVVDRLNDDNTKEAVMNIIDRVTELQRSGALNTLFDLVVLLHGVRSALTDSMVERLVMWMEHMVTNVANEDVADLAGHMVGAIRDAAQQTEDAPASGGMFATLSMLSKPETQKSLNFLLGVATNIQKCATKKGE